MKKFIQDLKRTHSCGALRGFDVGKEIVLFGGVATRRDHGGVMFVDLRDREGVTQIVFNPEINYQIHELAKHLRSEYVLGIQGIVERRPSGMENSKLPTGEIEVKVSQFEVFNSSKTPPFMIEDEVDVNEDLRLKYRYLDLRRPKIQKNFIVRHKVMQATRKYLDGQGFLEIETPMLAKSTPEGARDYLVPSRVHPGKFFALPQSPQLFKQLLMVAGFERYMQITKCFRDEDLRADRQPEFTQIDLEMSFVSREDVIGIMEGLVKEIWKAGSGIELKTPFPRLSYAEAMDRYGLDAPDTRFALELQTITDVFANTQFKVFANVVSKGGIIKAIKIEKGAEFPRSLIDEMEKQTAIYGAKGMAWIKVLPNEWQSPIVKFFSDEEKKALETKLAMKEGDLVVFCADKPKVVNDALGNLREFLGAKLNLIDPKQLNFVWVLDFPMFDYDEAEKRYVAVHHPFTSAKPEDLSVIDSEPLKAKANAYDLVLNGNEIGGGSIRIHSMDIQKKVFNLLGIGDEEAREKFGFLLDALDYGAPPHGGIAFGLDRIVMLLTGTDSIRDVIAFPKTQKAVCPMTEAPSEVAAKQLFELGIKINKQNPNQN